MKITAIFGCALILTSIMGCHRPAAPIGMTTQTISGLDYPADDVWDHSIDTLRDLGFRLNRLDRHAGIITTYPESSQHFFEFWRHDVATQYDWLEASINPIRRWVEIRIETIHDNANNNMDGNMANTMHDHKNAPLNTPTDMSLSINIQVIVHRERRSMPDRQFNDAGAAYAFFGYTLPATTGERKITKLDDQWISSGRDGAMEQKILNTIISNADRSTDISAPDANVENPQ